MRLVDDIRSQGGLAPTHHLLRRGWTKFQLARAVHAGEIIRVRQGWYSLTEHGPTLLRAVRIGGRLTCSSGARQHGIWTRSPAPPLHVAVPPHGSRLRDPDDYRVRLRPTDPSRVHWDMHGGSTPFLTDPLSCLRAMITCEPLEDVVAAADCALGLASSVGNVGRPRSATSRLNDVGCSTSSTQHPARCPNRWRA